MEDGEDRRYRHREAEEGELVGAHLAQDLRGGKAGVPHEVVPPHVGGETDKTDRDERREDPDGDLAPLARAGQLAVEEAPQEMAEQLELDAMGRGKPFPDLFHAGLDTGQRRGVPDVRISDEFRGGWVNG